MKRKLMAALLGAALMTEPLTCAAAYESAEEIALSLRPAGTGTGFCTAAERPDCIFVTPEGAAAGAAVPLGIYIEAERCELGYITLWLVSDSPQVRFDGTNYISPLDEISAEPQPFTLPDGRSYESKFRPYCLGELSEKGIYRPSAQFASNFLTEENALRITWQHGLGNAPAFLCMPSDAVSFTEFDMQVQPQTAPGVYTVGFNASDSLDENGGNKSKTYITSDESGYVDGEYKSRYADLIPTLRPVQIIVTEPGDANLDGAVNASDAAVVLIYAAAKGAGGTPSLTGMQGEAEELALRLADVSGAADVHTPDASDAAQILITAANRGGGGGAPAGRRVPGVV